MLNYLLLLCSIGVVTSQKPNFVLILTDDQDVELGGMTPMKNVRRFLADEGVTFSNSYVNSPICCPSRASLLTGLYMHNHRTWNNSAAGGCYGNYWRESAQGRTFPALLKEAGYNTFYAGKYLNEYGLAHTGGPELVPPGWSEWHGLVGNSVYYNYTLSNNGVPTYSTDEYLTDIIRELGVSYIENQTSSRPFLAVLAPPAPHQPFTPAPRHRDHYTNVTAVRHPNFNVPAQDKHWLLRMPPSPLPATLLPELDDVFRRRWEALLAVDELVADIVNTLETRAMLDNTYIIYTSDNGYHIGQFSQVYDKRQPYESDIKVPLIIKGPAAKRNATFYQMVHNIDLAPTILQLAGEKPPEYMDGLPIDLSVDHAAARDLLIEYRGMGSKGAVAADCPWQYDAENLDQCLPQYDCKCQDSRNNTFACIRRVERRINIKFCQFYDNEDFIEVYDLDDDPYELRNIHDELLPALQHRYTAALRHLLACTGVDCSQPYPPATPTHLTPNLVSPL